MAAVSVVMTPFGGSVEPRRNKWRSSLSGGRVIADTIEIGHVEGRDRFVPAHDNVHSGAGRHPLIRCHEPGGPCAPCFEDKRAG